MAAFERRVTNGTVAGAHAFDREIHDPHIEEARVTNRTIKLELREAADSPAPRPRLLVKHLSKAGGTFVIALAKLVVPPQLLTVRVEGQAVSRADFLKHFVLGLVREPCSSYVSMWAFGSSGRGEFLLGMRRFLGSWRRTWELYGARKPYNESSDVARFRSWMRLPEVRGVVTARFLGMQLEPRASQSARVKPRPVRPILYPADR